MLFLSQEQKEGEILATDLWAREEVGDGIRACEMLLMSRVGMFLLEKSSVSHRLRISLGFVAEMLTEERKVTKGGQSLCRLSGDLCHLQEQED